MARALRELREAMGLSQYRFAVALDVSPALVHKYETVGPPRDRAYLLWRLGEMASQVGRADLAQGFREAVLRDFELSLGGVAAQVEASAIPPRVAEALRLVRAEVLAAGTSAEVFAAAQAVLRYAQWRRRADAEDVQAIEKEIEAGLKRLRREG